jgi:glycosyltransferase involved in cell wall biosynthesis
MKILYVVHDFFPNFYGGTERYVLNLSRQMQRMGHCATVLTYGLIDPVESFTAYTKDVLHKSYVYGNLPVISIRHRTIPVDVGFVVEDHAMETAIEAILREKPFDVVHVAHPMRMASCFKAAKKLGIPVVLTLTDFWLICPRGRFFKPDFSLCNSPDGGKKCMRECGVSPVIFSRYEEARRLFEAADVLISPSEFLMGVFRANGWDKKILHINHGVDYKYVNPIGKGNRDSGKVVFGYTGVVGRFKGVDLLVNAFREVRSPNIALNIYGNCVWEDGFDSELNRAMEQDKRIRLMGMYEHDELPHVMSEVDIIVVPSTTLESYGLVVVESLAYGVPVIASDIVGSAYEYIKDGENGFIFPVSKAGALKNIIEAISKDDAIIERLRENISLPPRIEEEAFIVEKVYKQL